MYDSLSFALSGLEETHLLFVCTSQSLHRKTWQCILSWSMQLKIPLFFNPCYINTNYISCRPTCFFQSYQESVYFDFKRRDEVRQSFYYQLLGNSIATHLSIIEWYIFHTDMDNTVKIYIQFLERAPRRISLAACSRGVCVELLIAELLCCHSVGLFMVPAFNCMFFVLVTSLITHCCVQKKCFN